MGSIGRVSAIASHNSDPRYSDEIFTIRKAFGDGPIYAGDKIIIVTRTGYYFNSAGSVGPVSAVRTYSPYLTASDEIFTFIKHLAFS